jgi:predicted Rossmann-fold nucleotide-binding protein
MNETVGFTGTRRLGAEQRERVREIVCALPANTRIVVGGCIGVDDFVAWIARNDGQWVHGVIPADRSRVAPGWEDVCDTFEEMAPGTDYRARNQRIVELSDRIIAFPEAAEDDPRSRRSGTWMTVRIARRAGKPVHVEVMDGD